MGQVPSPDPFKSPLGSSVLRPYGPRKNSLSPKGTSHPAPQALLCFEGRWTLPAPRASGALPSLD